MIALTTDRTIQNVADGTDLDALGQNSSWGAVGAQFAVRISLALVLNFDIQYTPQPGGAGTRKAARPRGHHALVRET
jgi:hypothetical protein